MNESPYIRWFSQLSMDDVPLVGGKNASLGEMYRRLTPQGVKVPNGFAITAQAYRYMLDEAEAWEDLHAALDGLDADDVEDLATRGARARGCPRTCGRPSPPPMAACGKSMATP